MAAGDVRTRIFLFARPALGPARIDHLFVLGMQVGKDMGLGPHVLVVLPHGEVTVTQRFLALGQRTPFSLPLGQAAIENGNVMRAKHLEHEPGAGGGLYRAVIVKHDPAAIAQAQRLHAAGELFRRGQGVFDRGIAVHQVIQVHEHGAGNVSRFIFGEGIAAGAGQMLGAIDNAQVARAHFVGEPFRRNQTFHCAFLLKAVLHGHCTDPSSLQLRRD